MLKKTYDFVVIGGGIIGLAMARQLSKDFPKSSIAVLEKESQCGIHASTNNSGVIHAGFYYTPGSTKAIISRKGNQYLSQYCLENKVPFQNTGKLLIPRTEIDYKNLNHFLEVGTKNHVPCKIIDLKDAKEIEPNVASKFDKVFYSPSTSIANQKLLISTLEKELNSKSVSVLKSTKYLGKESKNVILTDKGKVEFKFLVNCAGQYSDTVAKTFGKGKDYDIMPVLGIYLDYKTTTKPALFKTLIYPVPMLEVQFPGAHWCMDTDGILKLGPNFSPVLWREQYSLFSNFCLKDAGTNMKNYLRIMLSKKRTFYIKMMLNEFMKFRKSVMINDIQDMTAFTIEPKLISRGKPGIMAQIFNNKTYEMMNDFIIENDENSLHILNAVSPGWTCSLAYAEYVSSIILKTFNK